RYTVGRVFRVRASGSDRDQPTREMHSISRFSISVPVWESCDIVVGAPKAVAERTGVSVHLLRAWERRYGVPSPQRSAATRYRVYDEKDIEDVMWMKRQVEAGVAPALAGQRFREQRLKTRPAPSGGSTQLSSYRSALERALLDGDESSARRTLDEAFGLFALDEVANEIIQPAMVEIGEGWVRNEVTVWHEHFATNVIKHKLAAIMSWHAAVLSGPSIMCACAAGEEHELGLVLFALAARRRGWQVSYLGQATPLSNVGDVAALARGAWFAVSISTVLGLAQVFPLFDEAARAGRKLVFGGRLLNVVPSLQSRLPGMFLGESAESGARNLDRVQFPDRFWLPETRDLETARDLQAGRLSLAGQVVAHLMPLLADRHELSFGGPELGHATLFLTDLLACALVFQAPELVDLHARWLPPVLSARGLERKMALAFADVARRGLKRMLPDGQARQAIELMSRLAGD
ncbi:MAG: cobalamin B12-binding domain-containing protein, partial [Chloroflexi bacterium]|nr:cobalamin B12-binding domain-containing protein [Chloroflexota bacterium]